MRLALSWLREYVELTATVEEIAAALVRLGHEVEAIEYPRASLSAVRIGCILSMEPHPNADRLRLLTVDIGEAAPLHIVCGATNMQVGDKIPVATIGTSLPNGMTIKKGKVRGEVSYGMCCSEAELGLAEDAAGLMILPANAPVGMAMGEYLQLEEAILELSITPNRGDCMSVRGLARDLAADQGLELRNQKSGIKVQEADDDELVLVREAEADCPYYLARRISGVRVGEAPAWLRARLEAAGQRSVNGVVDVLNYLMLDMGQPMHAFDASHIEGPIHIRSAQDGEAFTGLDERQLRTHAGDLVIADEKKVLAMAGIMGSLASGVTAETTDLVLESAFFNPARISLSRRTHGMVSEASMRFERGVDAAAVLPAMERATAMIIEFFGGRAAAISRSGDVDALCQPRTLATSVSRLSQRLGMPIAETADTVLRGMGFGIRRDGDVLHVSIPSWRHDVSLPEDISEEYARVMGYDSIPAILPPTTMQHTPAYRDDAVAAVATGCVQVINYAFISPAEQRLFVADDGKDVCLDNPISEAMSVMRRSLWTGLLGTARHNMNRQQKGVTLVETGRTYQLDADGVTESNQIAWLMCGQVADDQWYGKARQADFYDLKGLVETYLERRRVNARMQPPRNEVPGLQPGQVAEIRAGKGVVGMIGRVDVAIARQYDLGDVPVWVANINLDALPAAKTPRFSAIPEFPSVERDLVFLLPDSVTAEALCNEARKKTPATLIDVRLFDVYRGEGVPEGKVSMGLRLLMQNAKGTLTQDDCEAIANTVVNNISTRLGGVLR